MVPRRFSICGLRCLAFVIIVVVYQCASASTVQVKHVTIYCADDTICSFGIPNDVIINATPGVQILSQQMLLQLTHGSVLEHPFGSNTPPSAALIAVFPGLAFDSFVAAGGPDSNSPTPTIVGRSDLLGGPGGIPALFSPTQWDVLWGPALGQNTVGAHGYLSARLSLNGNALGTFRYIVNFGDGSSIALNLPIANGLIIPEPSAIVLTAMLLAISCAILRMARFG